VQVGGGGGCRKFESFVGNLGGFAPPPPEKVIFRHCFTPPKGSTGPDGISARVHADELVETDDQFPVCNAK
jgi:hypothetical protein